MIPFPFNENRFSFFVADHLLVGQLCTNPKSDRSFLSCLKVTQCSTSEIKDAPLYNSRSPRWGKQSFWLRLWSLVWFQVGLKVNTKMYLDVLKSVVIPWCNQVAGGRPWVWQQDSASTHKSKETQAWLQKECYDFVPFSHCPSPPLTWTCWTTSFDHTSRTSPTWPPTTPKTAWLPPSAEYSPRSRQRL